MLLLQVRRFGGSGGIASDATDKQFIEFLHSHPRSSPLRSSALKIVRKKFGYDVYYISAEESDRSAKRVPYSTPQPGGNFAIGENHFKKFDFLANFAEQKVISFCLVNVLNDSVFWHRKELKKSVLWQLGQSYQICQNVFHLMALIQDLTYYVSTTILTNIVLSVTMLDCIMIFLRNTLLVLRIKLYAEQNIWTGKKMFHGNIVEVEVSILASFVMHYWTGILRVKKEEQHAFIME